MLLHILSKRTYSLMHFLLVAKDWTVMLRVSLCFRVSLLSRRNHHLHRRIGWNSIYSLYLYIQCTSKASKLSLNLLALLYWHRRRYKVWTSTKYAHQSRRKFDYSTKTTRIVRYNNTLRLSGLRALGVSVCTFCTSTASKQSIWRGKQRERSRGAPRRLSLQLILYYIVLHTMPP